jgi:hypothetical protein
VYLGSEVAKTGFGSNTLQPGDALRLRVIEVLNDHRIIADFGRFRAPATVELPVQRGEVLTVKVVEGGRQLRLSVIQPPLTGGDATHRLSEPFKMLSDDLFQQIRSVIKPSLLRLKHFFDTELTSSRHAEAKNTTKPRAAVNTLLSEIDSQQNIAVKKHLHSDSFQVLTFMLPLKENDQNAKVKFYYPKKKDDGSQNGFNISILLNMDNIGEIRSDLYHLNKALTITFFVKDGETKKTIESHYPQIQTALDREFDYLVLRTVVSAKKIKNFHQQDWLPSEAKRLDVRI